MAVVTRDVSELCIGKPALWPLPTTATVADALRRLRCGDPSSLSVWENNNAVLGRVSVADVLCHLCSEDRVDHPVAALGDPISDLLPKDSPVRRVEAQSSILEALDVILDAGVQNLVVPIRGYTAGGRKKVHHLTGGATAATEFCLLTQEDFVRYFLNSISLFCPVATLSVSALGLVGNHVLRVLYSDPAISVVPLLRRAIADGTSVAVVAEDGCLVGEISPWAISYCDEAIMAAATAVLSVGELMSYIDFGGVPPESAIRYITSKLQENNQTGMLDLLEEEIASTKSLVFPTSSSSTSASSSEDEELSSVWSAERRKRKLRRGRSWGSDSEKETVVCQPESSLVAVMIQALARRVSYVWVVGDDYGLLGIVTFHDVLRVFQEQLQHQKLHHEKGFL